MSFTPSARKLQCLKVIASNNLEVPFSGYFVTDLTYNGITIRDRGILIAPSPGKAPGLSGTNVLKHIPEFVQLVAQAEAHHAEAPVNNPSISTDDRILGMVKTKRRGSLYSRGNL